MNKKTRPAAPQVFAPDLDDTPAKRAFDARPWLAVIVVVYLAFAVLYNVVTPAATRAQHNPDENGHYQYVQRVASGHLPVFRGVRHGPEFHQPPLYYVCCAPVYLLMQQATPSDAMHAVRAVSTVFGLLLILVCWYGVRVFLPDEPVVALLTAAFVGLLPMNIAMNASVGNDSLTNLVAAAVLAVFARIAMASTPPPAPAGIHKPDIGDAPIASVQSVGAGRLHLLLGVLLGVGVYTKSSELVLFPAVLVGYMWLAYRKVVLQTEALRGAATALLLGAVIGAPWLIRNSVLYGDPLGQKLFVRSFGNTAQAAMIMRICGNIGAYFATDTRWTFASFWGVFDSMTVFWGRSPWAGNFSLTAPLPAVYNVLAGLCLAAVIGGALYFRGRKPEPPQSAALAAFIVVIFGTWYGFTMFNLQFFQAQGRYWYTALLPLAFFFAIGWRGLLSRDTLYRSVSVLFAAGLVALNAYTVFGMLVPLWGAPW